MFLHNALPLFAVLYTLIHHHTHIHLYRNILTSASPHRSFVLHLVVFSVHVASLPGGRTYVSVLWIVRATRRRRLQSKSIAPKHSLSYGFNQVSTRCLVIHWVRSWCVL